MKYIEDLKIAFAKLSPQRFEEACCRLLEGYSLEFREIVSNQNALGKTRKGTPDAYVRTIDGRYIAFQFTTQEAGIKEKVLNDISLLDSEKCHFREKITKVVICFNTNVSSDIDLFYQFCEKMGWACKVFALDDLVRIAENNPEFCSHYLRVFIPSKKKNESGEKFYLCGERIKVLREERRQLPSQFIDAVDYYSEGSLLRIESGDEECPLSLINTISDVTGAECEWIKYGIGEKYLVKNLPYYDLDDCIEKLESENPREMYFCLDTERFSFYIIVKTSELRWSKFYVNYNLDFWNWVDDYRHIPEIYRQLKCIYKKFDESECWVKGRLYNKIEFERLEDSESEYLGEIIKDLPKNGEHWFDDIRDLSHKYPIADSYESTYGKWFIDMQEYFKGK